MVLVGLKPFVTAPRETVSTLLSLKLDPSNPGPALSTHGSGYDDTEELTWFANQVV